MIILSVYFYERNGNKGVKKVTIKEIKKKGWFKLLFSMFVK